MGYVNGYFFDVIVWSFLPQVSSNVAGSVPQSSQHVQTNPKTSVFPPKNATLISYCCDCSYWPRTCLSLSIPINVGECWWMLVNVGYRIPFIPINTHSFLLLVVSHYIPIKHHKSPWNYHDTLICEATGGCPLTRWHADACIVVHVENFKRLTATGTLHWVTNWTFHPQKLGT